MFPSRITEDDSPTVTNSHEVRAAKTMFYVVGSYFLCWAPLTILSVIKWFSKEPIITSDATRAVVGNFCTCAVHFHAAINPIIYAFRIRDVRNAIRRTFGFSEEDATGQSETNDPSMSANATRKRSMAT